MRQRSAEPGRIGIVSLGCPKALVDSERILTQLRSEGYSLSASYDNADLVIVNTCGFIDSAVDESMEAIGEAMAENGRVVVTGCLGSRAEEIRQRFPQVLSVTGAHAYEDVMSAVHEHLPPIHDPWSSLVPPEGLRLTPRHYAYLKISEGCNHRCTFCIIPSMRGDLVSRPVGEVLDEASRLRDAGVKELLVISQDTSAYGLDLKYRTGFWQGRPVKTRFLELCQELSRLGIWVRLHYVYPYPHVDQVIELMSDEGLLPYLDVPFQHANPAVLKRMKRPAHAEQTLERIRSWRRHCPQLTLRSTFIVGFPGETEAEFQELLDWLDEAQIDHLGAFAYSPVDGAAANALAGAVPEPLKQERLARLMAHQEKISATLLRRKVGRQLRVLVDDLDVEEDTGEPLLVARSAASAPEVDGRVFVSGATQARIGDWLTVEVEQSDAHDLWARVLPD